MKIQEDLIAVKKTADILPQYRGSPIELLLEYHNLNKPFIEYAKAQVLIGMCMDNRKVMHTPDNFAFVLRTGGGNLQYSEFKVSFAIGVGGVKAIALIAHNHCGMVNLEGQREAFIAGLVSNAGWLRSVAEEHFKKYAPTFELGNELDFVRSEAKRLRLRYPKILVAPLMYMVEDNLLYQVRE